MKVVLGSPWPRRLSACLLLSLCAGSALAQSGSRRAVPAPAPVETVEAQKPLVEQAREALANNQPIQALAIARRAEQQSPGDYKAPYYVSFALMELGELAEATAAAQRSQGLAPTPEAKAAVAQLQATLAAQGALSEADRAAAEGLHAKAGRLYQQAWEKGALPPEKALVAADLFQNQLKDGAMAARLLRDLPSRHAGTPVAEEAAKRLVSLGPALQEVARAAVEQARKREPADPERARWLRTAIDADADHRDAHLMLTNDAAENGDWAKLEPQLRLLQRKQWLQALLEGRGLSLGRWQEDARLRALLSDIWGDKRGAELLALNTTQAQPLSADAQRARGERLQALNQAAFEAAGLKAGTGVAFRDCSQCPELLWIPAGPMPQRAESASKLAPWLNRVRILEPLAVGKFEVTFDEWDACSAEGACKAVPEGLTPGTLFDSKWGRGRQPVINVSWEDAHTYLQWLSRKTGERYRLLSMTEYVYAARAMRSGEELRDGGANCIDCAGRPSDPRTVPVGSYPANPWGFHDMIGNVAEMVSDCNFNITDQSLLPVDGSPVNAQCSHRREHARAQLGAELLAMGGGWSDALGSLGLPVGQGYERRTDLSIGFRVVRTYKAR